MGMLKRIVPVSGSLLLCVFTATAAPPERIKSFDLEAMDRSADPCQDFFAYACAGWQKTHPIPPDQVRWGRFDMLREYNRAQLRQLLESAAAKKVPRDANEQKIGDYYATCMDESAGDDKSLAAALPWLK